MKRKIRMAGMLLGLGAGILLASSQAYGEEPEFPVRIVLDVPDEYYEDVTLLLGTYQFRLRFDHQETNMGYEWSGTLEKGKYPLSVVSPSDFGERYSYVYPETLTVDGETELRIEVADGYDLTEGQRENFISTGNREYELNLDRWGTAEPAVYQFAREGYNLNPNPNHFTTVLIVASVPEEVDTVTYYLVSRDKILDIELTREHQFSAVAYVPPNFYYESARYVDELYGEPKPEGGTYYMWTHGGNEDKPFGKEYVLNDGRVVLINDLVLKEVSKERALRVNDTLDYNELFDRAYGIERRLEEQAIEEQGQRG